MTDFMRKLRRLKMEKWLCLAVAVFFACAEDADNGSDGSGNTNCTINPSAYGCPEYCTANPFALGCQGSDPCVTNSTPNCSNYCTVNPTALGCQGDDPCVTNPTPNCPNYCTVNPTALGCPEYCIDKLPTIKLEGEQFVTLYTNQLSEFNRLMGRNQVIPFDGVVITTDTYITSAILTANGIDEIDYVGKPGMPPVGNYIIRYIATRTKCNGNDTAAYATRNITILLYCGGNASDTVTARIVFSNYPTEVKVGDTFNDAGYVSGNTGDGVLTRTINGQTEQPLGVVNTSTPGTVTITYRFCRTRIFPNCDTEPSCETVPKTITITEDIQPTTIKPVIVLNTYRYNIDGVGTFDSPDTGFSSTNITSFVDKGGNGVGSAYYVKDGVTNNINTNLVQRTLPSVLTASATEGNTLTYTLPESPGNYLEASVYRKIYTTENCVAVNNPAIACLTLTGTSSTCATALNIPKNTVWSDDAAKTTFRAPLEQDSEGPLENRAYRFGIDYGTLNSDNPQPGTYTIKYIALGRCSASGLRFYTQERQVIVSP